MKVPWPAQFLTTARVSVTAVRENVPVLLLTAVAFGASYGHIAKLCGDYGPHGWVQYATAACVDLLCVIGAEERQRDKRIGRGRGGKWVTWPTVILFIGILVTLAANTATADRYFLGYCVAAWPAGALLLAVSILERRASYETPIRIEQSELREALEAERAARAEAEMEWDASQAAAREALERTEAERDKARQRASDAVTEADVLRRELDEARRSNADRRGTRNGRGPKPPTVTGNEDVAPKRTDEQWLAEVRKLHAEQGESLSVRRLMPQLRLLGGGSGIAIDKATKMLAQIRAESEAAPEAGAVG